MRHHVDAASTCIDRVLDQLLDDACRALDHLAGGNAIDKVGRKLAYGHSRPPRLFRRLNSGGAVSLLVLPAGGASGPPPTGYPRRIFAPYNAIKERPAAAPRAHPGPRLAP